MAISQTAAAAGAAAAIVVPGSAAAAITSSRSKNGGASTARKQPVCFARSRSAAPVQQASIPVSSVSSSSLERIVPRGFRIAGEVSQVRSAAQLEVAPVIEDEEEDKIASTEDTTPQLTSQASISAFMADVANLVKLVDSKDIVELELKHKEYEIVIRKEAQQPPPPPMTFPGPHVMAHTSFPGYATPLAPPAPAPVLTPPEQLLSEAPAPAPAPLPPPPPKPSHPPMLSPMAGTFYRSPGPGEQPFVQVGDKVTKGQVVCIVEAMKLMNEIEADQSGTVVEILAEDGKPISIESPLFSIKP